MLMPFDGVQKPTFFTFSWCNFSKSSLISDRLPSSKWILPVRPSMLTYVVVKLKKKIMQINVQMIKKKPAMLLYCLLYLCHNRILTALSRLYRNVPFAQRSDDLQETFDDCIEIDVPSSDPMLWANTLTASYINAGSACGTTQNDRLIALFAFINVIDYWKYHNGQKYDLCCFVIIQRFADQACI